MEAQSSPSATLSIAHINSVVTALVTAHPDAAVRIARGADLVEAGAVEPTYGGVYLVYSQSEANRAYALVQDRGRWLCDCLDAQQRGQGCKHGWAALIYHTLERLHAEAIDRRPRSTSSRSPSTSTAPATRSPRRASPTSTRCPWARRREQGRPGVCGPASPGQRRRYQPLPQRPCPSHPTS
jgi:hypothetical protein